MFQVNDIVIYGSHGVCQITSIGTLSISMADKNKPYYTLRPLYQKSAAVYAPVENNKTIMRYILSKKEAEDLIADLPRIESVWITNEKDRELQYKAALQTCDCRELIKIIKTLYMRKEARIQSGKKVTAIDEKYFRLAESQLYEELACALDIKREQVAPYIADSLLLHEN